MVRFAPPAILFGSASILVLLLRVLNLPFPLIAQLLLLSILIIALFFSHVFLSRRLPYWSYIRMGLVWVIAFLTLFTVMSTGGLYSPLLILVLLFFIGASFLLSLPEAISFLISAVALLLLGIAVDPAVRQLVKDDPAVAILYLASFAAVVPLAYLISRQYQQKEATSKEFGHQVSLDQAILEQVQDLLFITDTSLTVLSVNKAAETMLKKAAAELVKKPLLDILLLRSGNGLLSTAGQLTIPTILQEKTGAILPDLLLLTANSATPLPVTLQVLPMTNLAGQVESLTFIVSLQTTNQPDHDDSLSEASEMALTRYQALTEQLKQSLSAAGLVQLEAITELAFRMSEDVRLSLTLKHITLEQNRLAVDVAQLCSDVVALQQQFGRVLGATVRWVPPTDGIAATNVSVPAQIQVLANSTLSTGPLYTATVDPQWLGVLLQKLLTLAIVITTGPGRHEVVTQVRRTETGLDIIIEGATTSITETEQLFQLNPNQVGSGLEAILARDLAEKLAIPLTISISEQRLLCSLHVAQRR